MTEEQLVAAAARLADSQEKFVEACRLLIKANTSVVQRLGEFQEYLQKSQVLNTVREEQSEKVLETYQTLVSAFVEGNANIRENTERLDKVLARMESYFGDGAGLEHEN